MPPEGGKTTPIEPGVIARLTGAVRGAVNNWLGPGTPIPTLFPDAEGRVWDYPVGVNLTYTPRPAEPVTFQQLRDLSVNWSLMRSVIDSCKDQIVKLDWSFRFKREPGETKAQAAQRSVKDSRLTDLRKFFHSPDGAHDWEQWLRMILEEMLVIDATSVYIARNNAGVPVALEAFDGATISPTVDDRGRVAGYRQVIKGLPFTDFDFTELVYYPRNLRTHKIYGFSPVEETVMLANIAIRRDLTRLAEYTDGNIPAGLLPVETSGTNGWTPEQMKKFQKWLDGMLSGNIRNRRRLIVVPTGKTPPIFPSQSVLQDEYDDILTRQLCHIFAISPSNLVKQVNRATADSAHMEARIEGYQTRTRWVSRMIERIVFVGWGYDDVEHSWEDERDEDVLKQAQVDQIYINAGVKLRNEVRDELGMVALTAPDPLAPVVGAQGPSVGKPNGQGGKEDRTASEPQA